MKKYIRILVRSALVVILLVATLTVEIANAEAPKMPVDVPQEIVGDSVKTYAYRRVESNFKPHNWVYFDKIIKVESEWRCNAQNPKTTAYGLGQLLDSTWINIGHTKSSDCYDQVEATITYIEKTYGTPERAWNFWKQHTWY